MISWLTESCINTLNYKYNIFKLIYAKIFYTSYFYLATPSLNIYGQKIYIFFWSFIRILSSNVYSFALHLFIHQIAHFSPSCPPFLPSFPRSPSLPPSLPSFLLPFLPPFENKTCQGLPWWSSGQDSTFPVQGARVQSLVRELDLKCYN